MNIGVFGRTRYLLHSAEKLHNEGHKIKFIYTCKAEKYYDKKEIDFQKLHKKLVVSFFMDDISKAKFIEKLDVDVCISFNWLNIIKRNLNSLSMEYLIYMWVTYLDINVMPALTGQF